MQISRSCEGSEAGRNKKQETRNKKQETRNKKQETRNKKQDSGLMKRGQPDNLKRDVSTTVPIVIGIGLSIKT
jgi:hypothetical protein